MVFERTVIHAPPGLLIDEVLDALDDENHRRVSDEIANDLASSGVNHMACTTLCSDLLGRVSICWEIRRRADSSWREAWNPRRRR